MSLETLYRHHLDILGQRLGEVLEQAASAGLRLDGLVLHAGREQNYHADDHAVPFHSTPHLRHWVPLDGPEHLLVVRPGSKPLVVRVSPRDFWYDTAPSPRSYWENAVELIEVESFDEATGVLGSTAGLAFVGGSSAAAQSLGFAPELIEPALLMAPFDWARAAKTPFEVDRMRNAAQRVAGGFQGALEVFVAGGSERELYWAFLEGSDQVELDLPFPPIVALDSKSAILHYQHKRGTEAAPGSVFLLDAGASCDGWASDVTRTWARQDTHPVFQQLVLGMDQLERELVAMVRPGRPYGEIHVAGHVGVARLLVEAGIARGSVEAALAAGVSRAFFPHGVGHHLGIQVHDVGGHMADASGAQAPPPPEYPSLRNTRVLEPGHVVTIEPGLYFIPMLLEKLRQDQPGAVDWDLAAALVPHGGIRIEDDVLCTDDGYDDLTREHIPGPSGADLGLLAPEEGT